MKKLYFFYGAMNAGKSAHILMKAHIAEEQGKKTLILKPKKDTRDLGVVKSRAIKDSKKAYIFDDNIDLYKLITDINPNIIFVDEVNFLNPKQIDCLADITIKHNIPVLCFGLLVDFKGELFESSKRLIELADSFENIFSECDFCKNKATHHLRKINDRYVFNGESILVGDTDTYNSVCRKCFYDEKNKSENS